MITRNQLTEIGTLNKTHGINGEISATFLCDSEAIEDIKCIALDIDGIYVPFFIESFRYKNDHTSLIKLEGIDTDEEVKPLVGNAIYALKSEFEEIDDDENDVYYFIGFSVVDDSKGNIGVIDSIDDSTDNYLFVINKDDDEILIPITSDYITKIDEKNKIIYMNLPNGLI